MEIKLIKYLSIKDRYTRLHKHIKPHIFNKDINTLLKAMGDYYASTTATEILWPDFRTWFFGVYAPALKSEAVELFENIFVKVNAEPSVDDEEEKTGIIKRLIELDFAAKIVDIGVKLTNGEKVSVDAVRTLVDRCADELGKPDAEDTSWYVSSDIEIATAEHALTDGLYWPLDELNLSAGPVRNGDFIVVAMRVESGKTTFLAHTVTHWASQMADGETVLWFNSEEQDYKVLLRLYQAALGKTTTQLYADKPKAREDYQAFMKGKLDKIQVVHAHEMSITDVQKIIEDKKPRIVVFDIIDHILGFRNLERRDLELEDKYHWARRLAASGKIVIASSQCDGSAEGQKWITMSQLKDSKTGKQGEADLMITMGRVNDPTFENVRYMHLPKNKLLGDEKTIPEWKHGYFEVYIQPEIARFKGISKS